MTYQEYRTITCQIKQDVNYVTRALQEFRKVQGMGYTSLPEWIRSSMEDKLLSMKNWLELLEERLKEEVE